MIKFAALFGCLICIVGCDQLTNQSAPDTLQQVNPKTSLTATLPQVSIDTVVIAPFYTKVITNGTIEAHRIVTVKLDRSGRVTSYPYQEQHHVTKGVTLVQLDTEELALGLKSLEAEYAQAINDKHERMVLIGGEKGVDTSLTEEQLSFIEHKVGLPRLRAAIETARYNISRMTTTAPISGLIADNQLENGQIATIGEEVCTIVDPQSYEAVFSILESDLGSVSKGQKISIHPLALRETVLDGEILRLNPIVDDNGMIKVFARIKGDRSRLLQGMKVQIQILSQTPPQITIPKRAIVYRSDRAVVFVLNVADQRAKWKYVEIAYQNDEHAAISKGLSPQDLIITDGHLNLDHDAQVQVINPDLIP